MMQLCATNRLPPRKLPTAVVAPTYNNAATLCDVLSRAERQRLTIIVVNDGSTDRTGECLARWLEESPERAASVTVIRHEHNRGKAAALRTGFAAAEAAGFSHALTLDTDAQHDPAHCGALLEASSRHPEAIILGTRDVATAGYPWRSRLGRCFSNFMIRLQSGLRVADSQCGFRIYPLKAIARLRCRAGRYGFETEVLTRATWANVPVVEVPVSCRYLDPMERVTHFRPFVDSGRSLRMHGRLMGAATWLGTRRLLNWISPLRAWREMKGQRAARKQFAAGLAVGVFIACLPAYGLQTFLCLFAARRFALHPLPVIAGSQLSCPPIAPLLLLASLGLGHVVISGSLPDPASWHTARAALSSWAALRSLLLFLMAGGVILGLLLSGITYAATRIILHFSMENNNSEPQSSGAPRSESRRNRSPGARAAGHGASALN